MPATTSSIILTVLIDHNGLQGVGHVADVASMSPLWEKVTGYDTDVTIICGHDIDAIRRALQEPCHRCGRSRDMASTSWQIGWNGITYP